MLHKMLQWSFNKECINALEQVKEASNRSAQRSRPLCHRRAMGRRPRQHLSSREPAPRMPVQGGPGGGGRPGAALPPCSVTRELPLLALRGRAGEADSRRLKIQAGAFANGCL